MKVAAQGSGNEQGMRSRSALRVAILSLAAMLVATGQTSFRAKVATEDGSPLPQTPQIIPTPSERLVPNCRILTTFGDGTVEYIVDWRSRSYDPATADMCSVTIRLKGYRTTEATFRQNAVIVLKRTGDNEGSLVSMTALKAPEQAQKAYGKGVVAMTDKKWAAAQKNFERAVEIYPDYAAAWSDLGQVLREQSNPEKARAAWERALEVDPKYVKPYLQLTRLDLEEKRMEDAASLAERALAINPIEFPAIYFYDAAANYNLKRLAAAEKSARRAIGLDTRHEIPRAEVLLGSVLAAEGDRRGAVEHLRKYLEISPKAPDAAEVSRTIAKLESTEGEGK
jgi:tetratricopeptide (TPR) repeat protein